MSGARGEATITDQGGRDLPILLTVRALMEFETATGVTVMTLVNSPRERWGMTIVVHLLRVGLEHGRRDARVGGKTVTVNDAIRLAELHGFTGTLEIVAGAFGEVMAYVREGEADPPA